MSGFISQAIQPVAGAFATDGANGEPPLPAAFVWGDRQLHVATIARTWRSTKDDRGDTYVKRHYFEFETPEHETAVVYFERQAKRGTPRWWLFTLS